MLDKRGIFSWALYDWANSAFPTIVLTFIFAAYYTQSVAINKIVGTTQWGRAIALAGMIIALLSPLLGAIADSTGSRKPWLFFFNLLCIVAAAAWWFVKPDPTYAFFGLTALVFGSIGLEVSMVFYNAMLDEIAPPEYVGRFSGWGWGFGYFGGLMSLIFALYFFIEHPTLLNLNADRAENIRICGPFVAIWMMIFSWPIFVFTHDKKQKPLSRSEAVRLGLISLGKTIRQLPHYSDILKFLIAHLFFIDGLNTIFAFGGIYAAGTFQMPLAEVIQFGIMMNIGAGVGAMIFGWLDDYQGSKLTILIALALMIVTGSAMLLVTSKVSFWLLGMLLSMSVGPIQSSSRSLMIHLAPKNLMTEMFGLYALSGKVTAFAGPFFLALATDWFDSQRLGMAVPILFLLIGGILLLGVRQKL